MIKPVALKDVTEGQYIYTEEGMFGLQSFLANVLDVHDNPEGFEFTLTVKPCSVDENGSVQVSAGEASEFDFFHAYVFEGVVGHFYELTDIGGYPTINVKK